ncbi:alpha/beta fold hydrolase [Massilia sp. TWR1-2-2]|uniref:alpha/beta fold hydrolase n=1 Tax=Massilia sp. TWR1-2-2 TaxID=2804584 RepID=UPI003CEFED6D
MPFVHTDGIETRYDMIGTGPPLLMFSPGGFNATLEQWSSLGIYARTRPLEHLARHYTCIVFDRRECGQSGGRIETVGWNDYVAQGKALLAHLGIASAHMMGGCMGCSPVLAFAAAHPQMVRSMVLYWPVGGARYRLTSEARFAEHLAYVEQHGLAQVVALVREGRKPFGADPRGGPWASVIARDGDFAERFALQDVQQYEHLVTAMAHGLIDRDTAPGAEPEQLMALQIPALVIPGKDASHATSAARYLEECLPRAEYWDAAPADQSEEATAARLLQFLANADKLTDLPPP